MAVFDLIEPVCHARHPLCGLVSGQPCLVFGKILVIYLLEGVRTAAFGQDYCGAPDSSIMMGIGMTITQALSRLAATNRARALKSMLRFMFDLLCYAGTGLAFGLANYSLCIARYPVVAADVLAESVVRRKRRRRGTHTVVHFHAASLQ
ncbi:MAG: hypothetical protein R2856_22100 [Caldilineaceae bacterium]